MLLDRIREDADELCRQYRLARFGVFGSVARGEERSDSDLDVGVVFSGTDLLFDRYMDLKQDLERRYARPVDVVTLTSMRNPIFRQAVEREFVSLHG